MGINTIRARDTPVQDAVGTFLGSRGTPVADAIKAKLQDTSLQDVRNSLQDAVHNAPVPNAVSDATHDNLLETMVTRFPKIAARVTASAPPASPPSFAP